LHRRNLLFSAASLPILRSFGAEWLSARAMATDEGTAFDPLSVRQQARDLASKPYKPPDKNLPDGLQNLDYDQYRSIRFVPDQALWRGMGLPFEVQFFHRGLYYPDRVDIFEIIQGRARRIGYSPSMFSFGKIAPPPPNADLGFAGFRLHTPLNRPDYYDEVAVFLGASYFRAVAKGQGYGLSARGLAMNTGDPKGEEFPIFKSFWLERPQRNARSIVVHALLDSASAAGAYRFTIRPGETTVFDVEMVLYPRMEIAGVGLAPLTSMFMFDANDRINVDDFRPAVHDSNGLAIHNGQGEHLWRPLHNPAELQISTFVDTNPRGFGLMQRERDFRDYQDLEARYERRPSLWIEPIGDWGEGGVYLVEIPSREEIHDNIVAFWRPQGPLHAKGEYAFTYRQHWGWGKSQGAGVAEVSATRIGRGFDPNLRLFVLDFTGDNLQSANPASIRPMVSASGRTIEHVVAQPNPETGGGWRLSFELAPGRETSIEMRAQLMSGDEMLSEVWLYRWVP
jgi:periplasmic glucans biosynthesis protein